MEVTWFWGTASRGCSVSLQGLWGSPGATLSSPHQAWLSGVLPSKTQASWTPPLTPAHSLPSPGPDSRLVPGGSSQQGSYRETPGEGHIVHPTAFSAALLCWQGAPALVDLRGLGVVLAEITPEQMEAGAPPVMGRKGQVGPRGIERPHPVGDAHSSAPSVLWAGCGSEG